MNRLAPAAFYIPIVASLTDLPIMTTDQLKSFISARPFRPFRIHMADGRTVDVNHPEWIAYAGGRIALVAKPDDSFEVVDLLLVPSLEARADGASRPS